MSSSSTSSDSSASPISSASSPSSPIASPLSTRQSVDWVPLFTRTAAHAPLAVATRLPSTPRRTSSSAHSSSSGRSSRSSMSGAESDDSKSPGRGSFESTHSTTISPRLAIATNASLSNENQAGDEVAAFTSGVISSPKIPESATMSRRGTLVPQQTVTAAQAPVASTQRHLRRRSSSAVVVGALEDQPKSSKMERMLSLTSYMDDPLMRKRNLTQPKPARFDLRRSRLRNLSKVTRWALLSIIVIFAVLTSRRLLARLSGALSSGSVTHLTMPPLSIYDTFETVPYSLSTHPRTPSVAESRKIITFADYLSTRLGSHFSFPPTKSSRQSGRQSTHLWLTTATNSSVRVSTRHLVAFVQATSKDSSLAYARGPSVENATLTEQAFLSGEPAQSDLTARRELVVLCRDQGCLDYCRANPDWFCYGGFVDVEDDGLSLAGEEQMKLRGAIEALETGRRVFLVDSDVYFKEDPMPHLGGLVNYDIQIPDSWTSSRINAGFMYLNPTRSVISLCKRLLDISLETPDERKRYTTTNLLIDPTGFNRDIHQSELTHRHEDKEFDPEDHAVINAGYGQAQFESSWAGGMDVKVLDRVKFRTSSGKLAKMDWMREKTSQAIYHHCVCCGDALTNDYIAGALGFHQPTVSYPHLQEANGVPDFPMVIKTTELSGDKFELASALGFLLQVAQDTNRGFVPPLNVTLVSSMDALGASRPVIKKQERYIWRMFPVASWAHQRSNDPSQSGPGSLVRVHEPAFVQHAVEHLRRQFGNRVEAQRQVQDLSETLIMDLATVKDYDEALKALKRPYFSTTKVVVIDGITEFLARKQDKHRFKLRDDFKRLSLCRNIGDAAELDEDGHGPDGKCVPVCQE